MTTVEYDRTPEIAARNYDSTLSAKLDRIWKTKPGLIGWLSSVDHKEIGLRYIYTAFLFLILGGIEALILRLQLARPEQHLLTPEQYDQLFSIHGATMILWYAFPILTGFSVYLQPLLIGARDMAMPRLNAFTYWAFLFSGLFLYVGLAIGSAPNAGWFNYVPLASRAFNPGLNIDFYALANIFLGISTTLGSINFVVTILRMRAPGMSINRLPILSWGTLTVSVGNLFAMPSVTLVFFLLWMDRQFGTQFFGSTGGQPLLWQHLFWMWGHPWVYAVVLPALSMVSDALPVLCRRPLVGYTAVALATVLTMVLGFGVWLHHMFATGLPNMALAFFQRGFAPHRHSKCGLEFRLARDDLDWTAGFYCRLSFFRWLHRPVRDWGRIWFHDRFGTGRLAAYRHLLHCRTHSLCTDRLEFVRGNGRGLFLVSQIYRTAAQ